jgi:hypothetical protein
MADGIEELSGPSRSWTIANGVMCALFIFSAVVQVNDPDPWVWMPIYVAAAALCLAEMRRRTRWTVPLILVVVAVIWAGTIAPRVLGKVGFMEMFGAWEMKNLGIEEEREMYGLLIVAGWMAAVSWAASRRRNSVSSPLRSSGPRPPSRVP